jgi:FkbM family methyltransferase
MTYSPPPHPEQHLLSLIPNGRQAIDVGANVGAWSYELLQRFDKVHAIEPQRECYQDLQALQRAFRTKLTIHSFAAWCNKGDLLLQVRPQSGMSNICGMDPVPNRAPEISAQYGVAAQPIDLLELGADFIKIDTEGAEIMVLLGLQVTIVKHRPTLLVEYHAAENRDWVMAWLTKRYYEVSDIPLSDQLGWVYAPRKVL